MNKEEQEQLWSDAVSNLSTQKEEKKELREIVNDNLSEKKQILVEAK
jgi:hypothetical protein